MAEESHSELAFIGLGNPGKTYAQTRHNLGFLVVEMLAHSLNWVLKDENRFNAKVAKGMLNGKTIHLILPMTFMNESGWAVRQYLDYYKLSASQIVVVCDDIALEFGQIRLRSKGSAGGHNGLKSINAHLGTEEYVRLRMGIGDYRDKEPLSDYVLSNFTAEESVALNDFIKRGAVTLVDLTTDTPTQVMNRVNTK